jgi:hypothetical protein
MTKEQKKELVSGLIAKFFSAKSPLDASITKNSIYTRILTLPYTEANWILVKYALENGSGVIDKYMKLWETGGDPENLHKKKAYKTLVSFIDLIDLSFLQE